MNVENNKSAELKMLEERSIDKIPDSVLLTRVLANHEENIHTLLYQNMPSILFRLNELEKVSSKNNELEEKIKSIDGSVTKLNEDYQKRQGKAEILKFLVPTVISIVSLLVALFVAWLRYSGK